MSEKDQLNLQVFSEDKEEFVRIRRESEFKPAVLFRKMLEAYKQQATQGACK